MLVQIIPPPIPLQWIFGIIGVVALAVAVIPLLQMIYGQPKIKIDFQIRVGELCCYIYNLPITGWLRKIHVTRMPVSYLIVAYDIKKQGTNEIVRESSLADITGLKGTNKQISLPSSEHPVMFCILETSQNGEVYPEQDDGNPLAPGKYYVNVMVATGDKNIQEHKYFAITKASPYLELLAN